jgi:hypothetical protein
MRSRRAERCEAERGVAGRRGLLCDAVSQKPGPRRGRVDLQKQMGEIERLRAEMRAKEPAQRVITTRAVARIIEDVHLEGRMGRFVVEADEPLVRGGTEKGASPLQFLMMGTAF